MTQDTIFAEATPPGRGGVSVIRLSGPLSWTAVRTLCGDLPSPRMLEFRILRSGAEVLDEAMVVCFAEGASYTGEQSAELHLHGSRAVVASVCDVLSRQDAVRLAEPGEFTRRALEAGKMDLTQVEALGDLIEAETKIQQKQAITGIRGGFSAFVDALRDDLVTAAALLESMIDFADEDVPDDLSQDVVALLERVTHALKKEVSGSAVSERIRDGFEVAIVGPPNIGKSTLLNRLAGREAAITSEHAGTTRDVIELRMDLMGIPVTFLDTAGLRDADDPVEQVGIVRARQRAEQADLRLFLLSDMDESVPDGVRKRSRDLLRVAKADLKSDASGISAMTGQGIDALLAEIAEILSDRISEAGLANRARHFAALESAINGLESAEDHVRRNTDHPDLAAEDLRHVLRALDRLIGRVDVENLLDVVFSKFCIGK